MDTGFTTLSLRRKTFTMWVEGFECSHPSGSGGWGRKVEEGDMGASSGASGHLEDARSPCQLWALCAAARAGESSSVPLKTPKSND